MRSTLKDIAKLTGLSISGISRALKDHPDISHETREKVKEVAKALNYHPNPNARFLRSQRSMIIAAILPEMNSFFFPEILHGINKVVETKLTADELASLKVAAEAVRTKQADVKDL